MTKSYDDIFKRGKRWTKKSWEYADKHEDENIYDIFRRFCPFTDEEYLIWLRGRPEIGGVINIVTRPANPGDRTSLS